MQHVPTISLADFRAGHLSADRLAALDAACADHGFFMLTDHGCEAEIDGMWSATQRFFGQSRAAKRTVLRDAENPLGYYDRELTKQKRDLKEVFDFKCGGHQSKNPARRTRWPQALPGFQEALQAYFDACRGVAAETTSLVFQALGLAPADAQALDAASFGEAHTSSSRLNCYPPHDPLAPEERASVNPLGDMALHHHTDPGGLTLLLQDDVGGLQARSAAHGWIDVPPSGNDFVVNLGDVMQVWTNDRYVAAVHRVLPVPSGRARYSTPFFYQPRFDVDIEPRGLADGEAARYRPFTWREFIRGRVTDNFSDLGEDDIQISRYRRDAA